MANPNTIDWKDHQKVNAILLKPDISVEESQELYRQWAQTGTYDQTVSNPKEYAGLRELNEAITGLWENSDALILDVGAGTGLTGIVLQEAGYKNIHALEPLSEFAKSAEEKGIYKKVIQEFIGLENKPLSIPDNTYDGVIVSGAFGPGHIPVAAVPEMVRITKPGGYIVNCMREEYLETVPEYKGRLEPTMQQLEKDGKWKLIDRKVYPNHFAGKNGLRLKYQVC